MGGTIWEQVVYLKKKSKEDGNPLDGYLKSNEVDGQQKQKKEIFIHKVINLYNLVLQDIMMAPNLVGFKRGWDIVMEGKHQWLWGTMDPPSPESWSL